MLQFLQADQGEVRIVVPEAELLPAVHPVQLLPQGLVRRGVEIELNPDCVTIPAGEPVTLLEVKWDAFLPSVIRDAVQLTGRQTGAFSKYAAARTC